MSNCINPHHDHELADNLVPGFCNECGLPTHYDEGTGWYHHDDPDIGWCFLTAPHEYEHTPCVFPEEE